MRVEVQHYLDGNRLRKSAVKKLLPNKLGLITAKGSSFYWETNAIAYNASVAITPVSKFLCHSSLCFLNLTFILQYLRSSISSSIKEY